MPKPTEMRRSKSWMPYFALGGGIFALSLSSLFVRWADAPGMVTSFYRMSIATLFLFPFLVHTRRIKGFPKFKLLIFPLLGGLFTSLDHAIWSTAINNTRVANATLLNNLAPLWVAFVAVFIWKERLRRRFWGGLILTLVGAFIILGNDLMTEPSLTRGDVLAIISSIFYAGYFLMTQRGRDHVDTLTYLLAMTLVSSLFLLGATQAFHMPLTGYSRSTYIIFLGAAIISQIGGYFSVSYALGHLPASLVSPTMIAQPVLTALMAIPFAGESLVPGQWIGGATVLCGIYLVNTAMEKNAKDGRLDGNFSTPDYTHH